MNSMVADDSAVQNAAEIIKRGGLVAFPTETVYGLGADAFDASAVARIFEAKGRPHFDPLIVHIADFQSLEKISTKISRLAEKLMAEFWPGPLTLVLQKKEVIPDIVTAGLPTVAVRMPNHPVALRLIRNSGVPIAAPSANPFGYLSPTTAEHVSQQLGSKVDFILDDGPCAIGVESTIVDLSGDSPRLLRPGGIPVEEVERVIGSIGFSMNNEPTKPMSPGQLPRHYSPRTPVRLLDHNKIEPNQIRGLLTFQSSGNNESFKVTEFLSLTGDLKEAAVNLFSCLHRLDKAGLDVIYVEPVPETGLGKAIMDRLRRACRR